VPSPALNVTVRSAAGVDGAAVGGGRVAVGGSGAVAVGGGRVAVGGSGAVAVGGSGAVAVGAVVLEPQAASVTASVYK
jgi:hypothetical protein